MFSAVLFSILAFSTSANLKVVEVKDMTHGLSLDQCLAVIVESNKEIEVKGLTEKLEARCIKAKTSEGQKDKPKANLQI